MRNSLKIKCLMVFLVVNFVVVYLILYKLSTLVAVANFVGYHTNREAGVQRWSPSNVSIWTVSVPEHSVSSTTKLGDANEGDSLSWFDEWVSPSSFLQLVKRYPFLSKQIVNPHLYNYTIFPTRVSCSDRAIDLAICVTISRNNFDGRQTVRETWGSYANATGNRAVLVFFIGSGEPGASGETQRRIDTEARIFGDILQESYVDHYSNLTLKSVSILKWATTYCPRSRYLLKADDDIYVNVPLLVKTANMAWSVNQTAFVVGSVLLDLRPIRDSRSKWYTPLSMYKEDVYPNYVSGTAYAMTLQAARLLYEASLRVPLFWLEDIYITGMCALESGISVRNSSLFSSSKPKASGSSFLAHISGHRYSQKEIRLIHKELYDPNVPGSNPG